MTILELLVLLSETLAFAWMLFPVHSESNRTTYWRVLLAGVAAALSALHLMVAGYRWEMIPAYLAATLLLVQAALKTPRFVPRLAAAAGLMLVAAAIVLTNFRPIFRLPAPGGSFAIGTINVHLIDRSRHERADPRSSRELMVQIWYPADRDAIGARASYLPYSPESFRSAHLKFVRTHAIAGAPMASALPQYPVLLYSPSWRGVRYEDTFLVESLASHGYVVACIDHPYGSSSVSFPDGRVIRADNASFLDLSSESTFETGMRVLREEVRVRAEDARFVLDQLAGWNLAGRASLGADSNPLFRNRLDISRAGMFGFSFGGAVSAEACWMDPRFRACMNMDGTLVGDVAEHGMEQPYLYIEEKSDLPSAADLASNVASVRLTAMMAARDNLLADRYASYHVILAGTHHMNFSDIPLYCPLRRITHAGPIDPLRAMRIIKDYARAFFGKHLQGRAEPLLDGHSTEYPEVEFRKGRDAMVRSR